MLAATVATFLVVLALLAYQVRAGRDPALGGMTRAALSASGKPSSIGRLTSRTSGAAVRPAGGGGALPALAPLTTRTSGTGTGEHDD